MKRRLKKMVCVWVAVLLLFMTPVCDYLDAKDLHRVDAASIAVGVTAVSVLKLTAAAFGVVIATAAAAKAVDSFSTWLNTEGTQEAIDTWNEAQSDAQSIAISSGFAGDVRKWLLTKFSALDGGEVDQVVVKGTEVTNGVACACPEFLEQFRDSSWYQSVLESDYPYIYWLYLADNNLFNINLVNAYSLRNAYLISSTGSVGHCYLYVLGNDGTLSFAPGFSYWNFYFKDNSMHYTTSFSCSTSTMPSFRDSSVSIYTTFPTIVTDLLKLPKPGDLFSDVLSHATATYNLHTSDISATSFGAYKEQNLVNLVGQTLNPAKISSINAAVDQVIEDNASTDEETGNIVYPPDISQMIIDAYEQGLEAVGTGSGEGEGGEKEDPDDPIVVPPDTSGILGFLQGLKDALQGWITAIPTAIGDILNNLTNAWTTLWGWLSDIASGITTGFAQVGEWIMDIPATLNDAFTNLQEWIADVPVSISGGLTDIKEAIPSLDGLTFPDVGAITTPITDAIGDIFTIDPDAIQEAIEAEQSDLFDLPFLVQAQELFDGVSFSDTVTYPKIKITTPNILRTYYDQPEIILLDFEDYKDYCLWARLLFRAMIWLAFVWHVVDLITPKFRIS